MHGPRIVIDASIKDRWEESRLGCLLYRAAVRPGDAVLWRRMDEELLPALASVLETTPLAEMPNLAESRRAYRAFAKDPGRCRVSSEALYRRIRQGKGLYRINSVVDANNLVSVETGFSLGSYDLGRVGPELVFRLGLPGESYAGIGKKEFSLENLPLLADGEGPFGSPSSDSTRAMITQRAMEVLTVIFSFSARERLEQALDMAAERFAAYASASCMERFIVE